MLTASPRLVLVAVATAIGCTSQPDRAPEAGRRSYYLGFSALPPRLDHHLLVQSLEIWTRRADIAIVHEELPWTELVAGTPPDSILRREKDDLIGYYRAKGLKLVFVADANDGLAREREAPQLRALGRSLTEPAIQRLYRDWIEAFARRYHPEFVGLAAETNLIRLAAPGALYDAVVTVARAAAADLGEVTPAPSLFVSVQVEVGWGRLGGLPYQGIERDFADFPFIDVLGLSSYPYFVWNDPEDLPLDYYSRLLGGRPIPVVVVEGGWSSGSGAGFVSSPAEQARYFARQAQLLDRVQAKAWLQLTPTDIDVAEFPEAIRELVRPFASLGVLGPTLEPKPALVVWDSVFALRRT
jgi:hypothetical protein